VIRIRQRNGYRDRYSDGRRFKSRSDPLNPFAALLAPPQVIESYPEQAGDETDQPSLKPVGTSSFSGLRSAASGASVRPSSVVVRSAGGKHAGGMPEPIAAWIAPPARHSRNSAPARHLANQYYFVAPESLIHSGDVPRWAGLISWNAGTLRSVKASPFRP
jgi:hypothetical protein